MIFSRPLNWPLYLTLFQHWFLYFRNARSTYTERGYSERGYSKRSKRKSGVSDNESLLRQVFSKLWLDHLSGVRLLGGNLVRVPHGAVQTRCKAHPSLIRNSRFNLKPVEVFPMVQKFSTEVQVRKKVSDRKLAEHRTNFQNFFLGFKY